MVAELVENGLDVWEMEFPTSSLGEAIGFHLGWSNSTYDLEAALSNPKQKIALWFEGSKKQMGLAPFKWYMIVNNRVFKRLTLRDIGNTRAQSGLSVRRDSKSIIYLTPLKFNKKDKLVLMEKIWARMTEEKDA